MIGRATIELLLDQPKTKSPYFFRADWGEGHFVGVVRVLDRVCAKARLADITPHTLRHTFASLAGDLGFSELTIAALLGHSARGVTQRYIHIDEALRMTADRVAGEMADILDGRAASGNRRLMREGPGEGGEGLSVICSGFLTRPCTLPSQYDVSTASEDNSMAGHLFQLSEKCGNLRT